MTEEVSTIYRMIKRRYFLALNLDNKYRKFTKSRDYLATIKFWLYKIKIKIWKEYEFRNEFSFSMQVTSRQSTINQIDCEKFM